MYRKFDVTGNLLFAQCFFFLNSPDANQMRRMVRCSLVGRAPLGKKINTVPHPTLLLLLGSEASVHNSASA
jgi:hypothetical protein